MIIIPINANIANYINESNSLYSQIEKRKKGTLIYTKTAIEPLKDTAIALRFV